MALADYDVIRELGRGGMAAVHLARQREMQRLVALKELGGFQARDPAAVERFLRESRMAGSLNHPNIVTVYEYFEDAGTPYIAMELVEGGSLRPLIGELSLPRVARVLEDVLAAVGHAGKAQIVHRDIKPENILITKDGRVKVADFGIAKGAAASGQQGLTSEGMTVGTPEYMSPEQALGKDVSPQSDLYSIGCMTYEMLTGRLPFSGDTQGALLVKQVSEPVPDVREVDPHIPESVAQWVATMTAKDPDDRFEDAAAAWDAFEEAVLEFIGPLWRRDATLEPGSEIDVSEIPDQTAKPLPRKPSSEPIATTGYQTYQAPAALHEVLEGDPDAAPAVVTPPPRPVAKPAARRATPPPVAVPPAAAGPPAAGKPPAEDEPESEPPRPLPVGLICGAAVVVAIVAFIVGMSSKKSEPAAAATGDGFVLKAPPGWKAAAGGLDPGTQGVQRGALAAGRRRRRGHRCRPAADRAVRDARRPRRDDARQARRRRGRAHRRRRRDALRPADRRRARRRGVHRGAGRARSVPRGRRVARAHGRQGGGAGADGGGRTLAERRLQALEGRRREPDRGSSGRGLGERAGHGRERHGAGVSHGLARGRARAGGRAREPRPRPARRRARGGRGSMDVVCERGGLGQLERGLLGSPVRRSRASARDQGPRRAGVGGISRRWLSNASVDRRGGRRRCRGSGRVPGRWRPRWRG